MKIQILPKHVNEANFQKRRQEVLASKCPVALAVNDALNMRGAFADYTTEGEVYIFADKSYRLYNPELQKLMSDFDRHNLKLKQPFEFNLEHES